MKRNARRSKNRTLLGANDDLWEKFHGLVSETWKGYE